MIRLICLDMDGVLVKHNKFWMDLHKAYGTYEEGIILTEKYLKKNYKKLVEEVIGKLWKGKPQEPYYELVEKIEFMENLDAFFSKLDEFQQGNNRAPRVIITGGAYETAKKINDRFEVDQIFANRIKFKDGRIEGLTSFEGTVGEGTQAKAAIVNKLCDQYGIQPQQVLFIGDSGIDIEAFRTVGFSIAFNSTNEELKKEATYVVDSDNLLDVIPILDEILSLTIS